MCSGFGDLLDVAQRLQHNVAQLHRSLCLFMGQVRAAVWSSGVFALVRGGYCLGWCVGTMYGL